MRKSPLGLMVALVAAMNVVPVHAAITISEVAPWSSGNSAVSEDWFELTNTGASAVDITGWSMDDSSATPGAALLTGVTSIASGQSVIFIEGDGSANTTFISTWFGATPPTGFMIGNYSGSGVGLSTNGDGVNIFNAADVSQASVSFGASPASAPFATFDNAAGLTGSISQLSVVGVNGAFMAMNASEIGSPGVISAVPEPTNLAMMLTGLGLIGVAFRKHKR